LKLNADDKKYLVKKRPMKKIIAIIGTAGILGLRVVAQTNDIADAVVETNANETQPVLTTKKIGQTQDLRMVNGQNYDVTTSKDWVSITIPAGTGLLDEGKIHFTGTVQPMNLTFSIPQGRYGGTFVSIRNFPYDAKYFYKRTPITGVVTKLPLNLRVFPLSHPTTNWNALGEMKITPARPVFDYGLPCTNNAPTK